MKPKIFDIHSHLNFPDFDKDREKVISRMKDEEIFSIVVGTDKKTSESAIVLAEKHENLFATVGLHPTGKKDEQFDIDYYKELAKNEKVVAIGETGIDVFRREKGDLDRQVEIFKKHIELAIELNKPLMIHCRDAHKEILAILKNSKSYGNIHFFSGNWEEAQKYFDLGFTISFAGVITFVDVYGEVIKKAPLEKIMIETDSPFVAPVPYRGKRNEPLYVKKIAQKIAAVRGISYEEVVKTTTQNAFRVFFN